MDMFAGIFDDLSSAVTGVGDYFSKTVENINFSKLTSKSAGMGKDSAPVELQRSKISSDEGLIPQGIPGIMNPDQAGKVGQIESAPYHNLEDRWTRRIQAFGSSDPKSGEVNFTSMKSDMDRNKTIKILTEGMK
jgi:hypothetical protein